MIIGNGVSYDDLINYFHERYFEQIIPLVYQPDEKKYYDIIVE
jgi:hypothetical protein